MNKKRHEMIIEVLNANTYEHSTNLDIAEEIERALDKCDYIRERLGRVDQERKKTESDYKDDMERLALEEDEICNECPHYTSTYHSDPSGGNDSHTTCDICGAEL